MYQNKWIPAYTGVCTCIIQVFLYVYILEFIYMHLYAYIHLSYLSVDALFVSMYLEWCDASVHAYIHVFRYILVSRDLCVFRDIWLR